MRDCDPHTYNQSKHPNHSPLATKLLISIPQVSFTMVGHKLPERRSSHSTNHRFGGYAHVGDAVPHIHSNTSIFSSITLKLRLQ